MNKEQLQQKRENEKKTVNLMIQLYCKGNHGRKHGELCDGCRALSDYANARTEHCPHMESKTFCSNCRTHCYKPAMREEIRKVMRWSGPRMLFRHPVLAVRHVIETKKEKRALQCR